MYIYTYKYTCIYIYTFRYHYYDICMHFEKPDDASLLWEKWPISMETGFNNREDGATVGMEGSESL